MAHLIRFDDSTLTLPIQYFGSVEYYALMSAFKNVVIDDRLPHDKRFKSAHRMTIADTRGLLTLTVPVAKTQACGRRLTWADIPLSNHGQWWHVVLTSLESAYGRTPFFEYYIDRFKPFFAPTTTTSFDSVASLDAALNSVLVDVLGLEGNILYASQLSAADSPLYNTEITPLAASFDAGNAPSEASFDAGKTATAADFDIAPIPYYQIRADKHGFIPSLSVLDLIFNLGPESPLHLRRMEIKHEPLF